MSALLSEALALSGYETAQLTLILALQKLSVIQTKVIPMWLGQASRHRYNFLKKNRGERRSS